MSQGDAPCAGLEIAGLTQLREGVLALIGDLHQSGVGALEDAEADALVGLAVVGDELGFLAGLDGDVAGGHHQPVLAHEHAAAARRADLDPDGAGEDLRHDRADLCLDRSQFGGIFRRFDARDVFRVLGLVGGQQRRRNRGQNGQDRQASQPTSPSRGRMKTHRKVLQNERGGSWDERGKEVGPPGFHYGYRRCAMQVNPT